MVILAAGGIIIQDNKVLLMYRINSTYPNMWSNPGGKIEPDETPEQAIIREVEEELGIKTRVKRYIVDYQDYEKEELIGVYKGFELEIIEGTPEVTEKDKATEIKWFDLNNLPNNIAPYTLFYLDKL